VIVENIPPNISTDDAAVSIAKRAAVADEGSSRIPDGRIVCKPATGVSPEQVRDQLSRVYGVYTTIYVALPRSLPATIRQWVKANQAEDLAASLTTLETAIRSQPSPRY
jgi:hypothetical protein